MTGFSTADIAMSAKGMHDLGRGNTSRGKLVYEKALRHELGFWRAIEAFESPRREENG